jgi:glutamyl-tRNA reductase
VRTRWGNTKVDFWGSFERELGGFSVVFWRCRGKAVGMGSDCMDVGFLGLGVMGIAMARNLLKKGFKVTVWNRSPAKVRKLLSSTKSCCTVPFGLNDACIVWVR